MIDKELVMRLTDATLIEKEIVGLISEDTSLIQMLQQGLKNGELLTVDKLLSQNIQHKLDDIEKEPIEYLKAVYFAHEHLLRNLPYLFAENNKRILNVVLQMNGVNT